MVSKKVSVSEHYSILILSDVTKYKLFYTFCIKQSVQASLHNDICELNYVILFYV